MQDIIHDVKLSKTFIVTIAKIFPCVQNVFVAITPQFAWWSWRRHNGQYFTTYNNTNLRSAIKRGVTNATWFYNYLFYFIAVWRAGAPTPPPAPAPVARSPGAPPPPPPPPVWTPGSAGASPQTPRKTFRPVHFEETPPSRRKFGASSFTDIDVGLGSYGS